MTIRKQGDKYVLMSATWGKDGKRRKLGEFKTRSAAEKREREIQFFKHKKGRKSR